MSHPTSPPDDNKPDEGGKSFPWAKGPVDHRPVYRVVELVRDADGRVRKRGNIWHTNLDVPRKFGRAMAANTSAHRVVIEDNQGRVLEEVPVTSSGERKAVWSHWEDIPLPALPPTRQPPRHVPVLRQPPKKFEDDHEGDEPQAATQPSDQNCDVSI